MTEDELYRALVALCQDYGRTTEATYDLLHEAIDSIDTSDEDEPEEESTYSVWCYYQDASTSRTLIEGGLTLEQAQEICNDPDTSSRTTTTTEGKRRTERFGPWFYGYTED